MGVTADTVRGLPLLWRELDGIGIGANLIKTVAPSLPPNGHAPAVEEIYLLESVDVRLAGDGGVTRVGNPIGTKEYMVERAVGEARNAGVDFLWCCLASENLPGKQAVARVATQPLVREPATSSASWT